MGFSQIEADQPKIAQGLAFGLAVADLAVDGQSLFVKLDGAACLAQIRVSIAKVSQRGAFPAPVSNLVAILSARS